MKKRTRILCFIPLLIFISFGIWNYFYGWTPPEFSPELFHTVSVDLLLIKHPGAYEVIHNLIIQGKIIYMNIIHSQLQLYLEGVIPLRVNCCFFPQAFQYRIGDTIYLKGFAYLYLNSNLSVNFDLSKGYFLATDGYKLTSYSLQISIGGLAIILIVLFTLFKIKPDLSFKRRGGEDPA